MSLPALVVFSVVTTFAEATSGRRPVVFSATSELGDKTVIAFRSGQTDRSDGDVDVLGLLRLDVVNLQVADLKDLAGDLVHAIVTSESIFLLSKIILMRIANSLNYSNFYLNFSFL